MRRFILLAAAALLPVAVMARPASAVSSVAAPSLPQTNFTLYEHWSHLNCFDPVAGECTVRGTLHVGGRHGPVVGTEYKFCIDSFCQSTITMSSPVFGQGTFLTLGFFSGARWTRLKVVDGTGDFAGVRGHIGDTFLGGNLNRLEFHLRVRS